MAVCLEGIRVLLSPRMVNLIRGEANILPI